MLNQGAHRIVEEEIESAVDSRNDALQALRELGPPDLVHLVKQSIKSGNKQSGVYHHVTGIDASSSASLAAYVNTLTYNLSDRNTKIVSGLYWYAFAVMNEACNNNGQLLQCIFTA